MDQDFSFGEWIRKRRSSLGLTQEALANQVGYSVAMIRKIEDDERRPTPRAAALLAQALNVPEDQRDIFIKVARQERAVDRLAVVDEEEPFPWIPASRPLTHLPLPATPFIGREVELARLTGLLQDPASRLVVLTGLAGTGKTRLALEAAHNLVDRFPQGVGFVSLASLTHPEMIVTGIGNAIGFQFNERAEPEQQLLRHLREKQMLLVLDNFEHLKEGAGLLSSILEAAPGIRILVTSRERLNLQGEWMLEVQGLPYPSSPEEIHSDQVEAYEAVRLFMQKALQVHPAFTLNEENRECVARICRLVEGMPLGIELAAAWVRALPCQQIYQEIENSLDFLTAYARDVPERHRSLRAALDFSWDLLTEEQKAVFRRLSVFQGGFRRDAAQDVAGANLEELTSLLDRSLVKRAGEERYDLHELVRQYAASHLHADPQEQHQTYERHSSYYAALMEQWEAMIASPSQAEALAEIEAEIGNVRQAWSWMVAHSQIGNIQKSLRSLWRIHDIRGWFKDGVLLMWQAVSVLQKLDEPDAACGAAQPDYAQRSVLLGRVLAQQGYFCTWLGRYKEARELLQQSLNLLHAYPDQAALAFTLAILGYMQTRLGEFEEARQHIEKSLSLTRILNDYDTMIYCLVTLSYIHISEGEYEKAYELSSEGLRICQDLLGNPLATEHCLLSLSAAASYLGHYSAARQWAEESLQISKTLNHRLGIAYALHWLGLISSKLGETRRAESLLRQSVFQSREIGDSTLMAEALIDLGMVAYASGAREEAKQSLLEALQTALKNQMNHLALKAIVEMAGIEMQEGDPELALEMVTHSLMQHSAQREVIDRAGSLQAELSARLTLPQIEAVEARARARTLESLAEEIFLL